MTKLENNLIHDMILIKRYYDEVQWNVAEIGDLSITDISYIEKRTKKIENHNKKIESIAKNYKNKKSLLELIQLVFSYSINYSQPIDKVTRMIHTRHENEILEFIYNETVNK